MAKKRFSGLDELMIVNPGLPHREEKLRLGEIFLSEDGTRYRLEGLQKNKSSWDLAEFYLGEDGTLYRLERFDPLDQPYLAAVEEPQNRYTRFFLGEDGTLYQVIR